MLEFSFVYFDLNMRFVDYVMSGNFIPCGCSVKIQMYDVEVQESIDQMKLN